MSPPQQAEIPPNDSAYFDTTNFEAIIFHTSDLQSLKLTIHCTAYLYGENQNTSVVIKMEQSDRAWGALEILS